MTNIRIPLKDTAPTPLPVGVYNVDVEKVSDLRTVEGADGKVEVIDVTWKVSEGEPEAGRKVVDTYWLLERAFWRISILTMQLLGVKREDLPEFSSTEELNEFMKENFLNTAATIEVDITEKNDQQRNRVKKVFARS